MAIVSESDVPRMERNHDWPFERLPVPADLLVHTVEEWCRMRRREGRFAGVMESEVVWVVGVEPDQPGGPSGCSSHSGG